METGRNLIKEINVLPEEILYLGDTTHDFDVARELGCKSILIAAGHNSYERLTKTGAQVVDSLKSLIGLL